MQVYINDKSFLREIVFSPFFQAPKLYEIEPVVVSMINGEIDEICHGNRIENQALKFISGFLSFYHSSLPSFTEIYNDYEIHDVSTVY